MAGGRVSKSKGSQSKAASRKNMSNTIRQLTAKENSDIESAMPPGHDDRKVVRLRGIALKVDTKLAQNTYKEASAGIAANMKPNGKTTNGEVSKLSEAMMNKNWRNPRYRPEHDTTSDDPNDIWSAPPEKPAFTSEAWTKPQRSDHDEVMDYERGLKRVAYRCIKPQEVRPDLVPFTSAENVDPGLCLSAPATKLEYHEAEVGGQERSEKYSPSVFQPAVKSIVRLDQMAPAKRVGYERIIGWDENSDPNDRLQEWNSVAAVSTASPDGSDWVKIRFPFAEIRPVKGEQGFPMALNGVEKTLRRQVTELVLPQTAGLPPDHMRRDYQVLSEDRLRIVEHLKSKIKDGPALKEIPENEGQEGSVNDSSKDNRLNALLGKLNRLCAPRLRACTIDNPENKGDVHGKAKQKSPSEDSGVSGVSPVARKRASSLNPAAVEFRCTTKAQPVPVAAECPTPMPALTGPDTSVVTPGDGYVSKESVKMLETRIAQLEAKLARQQPKDMRRGRQKWASVDNNLPVVPALPVPPGQNGQVMARGASYPGVNGPFQYTPTPNFQVPQALPQALPHALSGHVVGPGMQVGPIVPTNHNGFAPAQHGMAPSFPAPNATQPTVPHHGNGLIGQPPYRDNSSAGQPSMPPISVHYRSGMPQPAIVGGGAGVPAGPGVGAGTAVGVGAGAGAGAGLGGGAPGTQGWVKSVFGPKPVAKPKGPFRPGDASQAMRQQQYEEYLEHLRATDPSYAMKCKQRQARRADRRRTGIQSDGVATGV